MRDEEERQDLRLRTKDFALRIIRMYSALSKTEVSSVIGRQVLRSGTSVGANYREAYRARSSAEFVSKLGDCLKELEETAYWLELLVESGCMPAIKLADLMGEASELTAIFTSIVKRLRNRPSS
jgi:four helix bundle protein